MQLRSLPVGRLTLSEISGSLGDLGILIPLLVGMAHQGSVHFVPALFFAGLWNFATGLLWDVPMCVQPMKTIAAVALADGLSRVQVSLAGLLVAAFVLLLGPTYTSRLWCVIEIFTWLRMGGRLDRIVVLPFGASKAQTETEALLP